MKSAPSSWLPALWSLAGPSPAGWSLMTSLAGSVPWERPDPVPGLGRPDLCCWMRVSSDRHPSGPLSSPQLWFSALAAEASNGSPVWPSSRPACLKPRRCVKSLLSSSEKKRLGSSELLNSDGIHLTDAAILRANKYDEYLLICLKSL